MKLRLPVREPESELRSYSDFNDAFSIPSTQHSSREDIRICQTIAGFPADYESIVDVGCGDGRLLVRAQGCRSAVGVDFSMKSLQRVRPPLPRVQAGAHALPFADASFDMVVCTEVLEHLPEAMFAVAQAELARISRRYVLITVPHEEDLREDAVRCRNCFAFVHKWGHVRTFDRGTLEGLFRGMRLERCWVIGPPEQRYSRVLLRIHALFNSSPGLEGRLCPYCERPLAADAGLARLARNTCDFVQVRLLGSMLMRPYWVGALYRHA